MSRRVEGDPASREAHPEPSDAGELSDADLEVVVGGLWRAWPVEPPVAERVDGATALFDAFMPSITDGATGR